LKGTVKKVAYTILYDFFDPSENKQSKNVVPGLVGYQIKKIVLDLVIEDIDFRDSHWRYEQEFHVKFEAMAKAAPSADKKYMVVEKSGNPGYVTGKPLLIGLNKDFSRPQMVE